MNYYDVKEIVGRMRSLCQLEVIMKYKGLEVRWSGESFILWQNLFCRREAELQSIEFEVIRPTKEENEENKKRLGLV